MVKLAKEIQFGNKMVSEVDRIEDCGNGFVKLHIGRDYETVLKAKISGVDSLIEVTAKADVKKASEPAKDDGSIDITDLSKLKFNELQKVAVSFGIKHTQKAEALREQIQAAIDAKVATEPEGETEGEIDSDPEKTALLEKCKVAGIVISNPETITIDELKELVGE